MIACASREQRIVVTKDDDFVQSFLLAGQPSSLLLVATGNITNAELEMLVRRNFARIEAAFGVHRFVELNRDALVIHESPWNVAALSPHFAAVQTIACASLSAR